MVRGLVRACLLLCALNPFASTLAESPIPSALQPAALTLTINGQAQGIAVLLQDSQGRVYARETDWRRWRLRLPEDGGLTYEGERWYPLSLAPGYRIERDERRQTAVIDLAPQAFIRHRITARRRTEATPTAPDGNGVFLNYEAVQTFLEAPGDGDGRLLNGRTELGLFGPWGVTTSEWLGLNLAGDDGALASTDDSPRVVRLETSYVRDFPDNMQRLSIGDALGGSGLWGRPLRFGGVRWARNFRTRPGFITLPQPQFSGSTSLPSVLELYVNGSRRERRSLSPGEFVVDEIPIVTGEGNVEVVVTDLLGREQVISESYFTGVGQLRKGLRDYSYELGWVRKNFGVESNDYGDMVFVATEKYGLADALTSELRLETYNEGDFTFGAGGILSIWPIGTVSTALALSHANDRDGTLRQFSFQRSARKWVGFGARVVSTSRDFRQAGLDDDRLRPSRLVSANLRFWLRRVGTLGFSWVQQDSHDSPDRLETLSSSLTSRFRRVSLSLRGSRRLQPAQDYSVGLNLSMPFGAGVRGSSTLEQRESASGAVGRSATARVNKTVLRGKGWGYRAGVSRSTTEGLKGTTSSQIGANVRTDFGAYDAELRSIEDSHRFRIEASGAVGRFDGQSFATRELKRSFALVDTGEPGIDLIVNNRLAATTGSDGTAVLPEMQPYQRNRIRIDAADLPLNMRIGRTEDDVAPYFRSGVVVSLPVERQLSAVLRIDSPDGRPVPAGATARLSASAEAFPVAGDGFTYLDGLQKGDNEVIVTWADRRCGFNLRMPWDAPVQVDLGRYSCAWISQ